MRMRESSLRNWSTRLFTRARRHGLLRPGATVLGICWDDEAITPEGRKRYDACLGIPPGTLVPRELHCQELPAGKYAVCRCRVRDRDFHTPWRRLYSEWLPSSGQVLDDRPPLEVFPNLADDSPRPDYDLEIRLPLKG